MAIGSCDGTMRHTREGEYYGGACLERVEAFMPRLAKAALRLCAEQASTRLFLSDAAEWIGHAAAWGLA